MADAASDPLIWVVSDGRAGIERQARAIADALVETQPAMSGAAIRTLQLDPGPPQVWLPPGLWWSPLAALRQSRPQLTPPWPDVWIAAGRRSIPYSLAVRGWSQGRTFVVQTQDPRAPLDRFDLVCPPEHDGVAGPNVVATTGSPVWFSAARIAEAEARHAAAGGSARRRVLLVVGGNSKTHQLSRTRGREIAQLIPHLQREGHDVMTTVSRRTPVGTVEDLRLRSYQLGAPFWESEARDGPNPYLAWLRFADAVLVTEDSTNLLSDAAFFGLPIHVLKLEGRSPKFDRLHDSFIQAGRARWWTGELSFDRTPPLREAERIAQEIVKRLPRSSFPSGPATP
jgi:mitochondrial fission protein ELM1